MRIVRDPAYWGRSMRCRFVWKNTVSVPATKPCWRSFSAARVFQRGHDDQRLLTSFDGTAGELIRSGGKKRA